MMLEGGVVVFLVALIVWSTRPRSKPADRDKRETLPDNNEPQH